ncbi:MAG: acyl-CoA/acyl-ACP dehydrogenase [Chloroflexi bacterium]|nr:acyl-CoA/acyl-ACP dehydrogenase [Chloroflexota bacterium]
MDFNLTQEQEMLRSSARDFLQREWSAARLREVEATELGYSRELWRKTAALGWMGIIIPEEYGGMGGGLTDLGVVVEETGRAVVPSPFFVSTMFGAIPVLEIGSPEQKHKFLPSLAKGELVLTMAVLEEGAKYNPACIHATAARANNGYIVQGRKLFVPYAHVADVILCVCATGQAKHDHHGHSIFMVERDSPGVHLTALKTISREQLYEVHLESVRAEETLGPAGGGWPVVEKALLRATAVQCAEMTGLAQQTLDMTVEYIKGRVQFGKPIGAFQAAQHQAANMLIDVEGIRWATYAALGKLDRGEDARRDVAIAKAWASDALRRVAATAHHLHGGMGVNVDYDLHFYSRRAKARELELGHAHAQRERIVALLGL